MIGRIDSRDIIHSNVFISEPVNEICDRIKENKNNKIILKGFGKSVVLYNLKYSSVNAKNPYVYARFDSVSLFYKSNEKFFNDNFKRQYYELGLCFRLLGYIKKYYGLVYEKYFKEIYIELEKHSNIIDSKINFARYKDTPNVDLFELKEPAIRIINRLKEVLKLDTLNIGYDRFDWVNGGDAKIQQILSEYFNLFDKVVLTTDDDSIDNKIKSLEAKGYSVETLDYGKNINYVRQMVKARLDNLEEQTIIKEDYITDEIYKDLIEKTNGDMELMFAIVNEVIGLCAFDNSVKNLEKHFSTQSNYHVESDKKFRKMFKYPNLYL